MHKRSSNCVGLCCASLSLLTLLAVSGCAVDGPKEATSAGGATSQQAISQPEPEKAENKPRISSNLDKNGFTIKEIGDVDSRVRADFEKALGYLSEEKYEDGIALLKAVAQRAPNHTAPYINLAIAYQKIDKSALAEENIKKALALNPDHPLANNEYAMIQRKTGHFTEARETYEKTLKRFPTFLPARKNLAILCDLYIRDLECALKHYQILSAAVPNDKNVRIWIADLEKRIGR